MQSTLPARGQLVKVASTVSINDRPVRRRDQPSSRSDRSSRRHNAATIEVSADAQAVRVYRLADESARNQSHRCWCRAHSDRGKPSPGPGTMLKIWRRRQVLAAIIDPFPPEPGGQAGGPSGGSCAARQAVAHGGGIRWVKPSDTGPATGPLSKATPARTAVAAFGLSMVTAKLVSMSVAAVAAPKSATCRRGS